MRSAKFWAKGSSVLVFALLLTLALPKSQVTQLRRAGSFLRVSLDAVFKRAPSPLLGEVQRLKAEKALLMAELERTPSKSEVSERGSPLLARVIQREAGSWNSRFWINVGERDNLNGLRVGKNSPVLLGESLIGLVDQVEAKRSLVILVTDPAITPAVRAVRGGAANKELKGHLDALFETLLSRDEFFESRDQRDQMLEALANIDLKLQGQNETLHLAKGLLQGAATVAWRSRGSLLKGVGFNYDQEDGHGPARELRSGAIYADPHSHATPLLKSGDLLITTGLDGVFPEGLCVARVTSVTPLKEGAHHYEIEARLTSGDLEDVRLVSVLPPLS